MKQSLPKLSKMGLMVLLALFVIGGGVSATTLMCGATTSYETQTTPVSFDKQRIDDPSLDKGKTMINRAGVDGEKKQVWKAVSYKPLSCKSSSKVLSKEEITKQPVAEVTSIGTKAVAVEHSAKPSPIKSVTESNQPVSSPSLVPEPTSTSTKTDVVAPSSSPAPVSTPTATSPVPAPTTSPPAIPVAPPPSPLPPPPTTPSTDLEQAYLVKDISFGDSEIIQRANGEQWLLQAKTVCLWCYKFEGRLVTMKFNYLTSTLIGGSGEISEFWTDKQIR